MKRFFIAHLNILEFICDGDNEKGITARQVRENVDVSSKPLAIIFLNELASFGLLRVEPETCVGGTRNRYFPLKTKQEMVQKLIEESLKDVMKAFPEETMASLKKIGSKRAH